ncbi:hypothetical protein L0244_17145 [bacterium]|nr:hypothetical protein [bacterium]
MLFIFRKDRFQKLLQTIKKALDLDSTLAEAFALEGTFYLLKAEVQKDKAMRSDLISKSKKSLEYALKLNKWLKKEHQPVLDKANQSL